MCDLLISDEDIREAEAAVLEAGQSFNEEQVAFIKCLDSIDLDACPGSGKSTALVGKLFILAKYRVWDKGKPICVVSHTNVAVDEIREKVARQFPEILAYPNFIGTLQSFVDEFFAIPYYRTLPFANRVIVDDEMFASQWASKFNIGDMNNSAAKYIRARFCQSKDAGGIDWNTFDRTRYENEFVSSLSYRTSANGYELNLLNVGLKNSTSATHQALSSVKKEIFESGCLTYADAYCLAEVFVKNNKRAAKVVGSRFRYVFLDEAQDTDKLQMAVLEKVFDDQSHCYQRLGDPLQAIYNTESKEDCAWVTRDSPFIFRLRGSNRFGAEIASVVTVLSKIIASGHEDTVGSSRSPQKCLLFPFDPGQEQGVITRFETKVRELLGKDVTDIYAVGAVGQKGTDPDKLTIVAFDPAYVKPKPKGINREYFSNNATYFTSLTRQNILDEGSAIVFRRLLLCMRNYIRKYSDMRINLDELKKEVLAHSPIFSVQVMCIARLIVSGSQPSLQQLQDAINEYLKAKNAKIEPMSFKDSGSPQSVNSEATTEENPIVHSVTLATIHAVKGQTHNATLLLTTQHKKLKVKSGDLLGGTDIDYLYKDSAATNRRKLVYVAASRPRYIFGWAVPREKVSSIEQSLLDLFEVCEPT